MADKDELRKIEEQQSDTSDEEQVEEPVKQVPKKRSRKSFSTKYEREVK